MLRRLRLPAAVVAVTLGLVAASYLAQQPGHQAVPARGDTRSSEPLLDEAAPSSRHEVERLIRVFERRAHETPTAPDLAYLARLYLQRAKVTGDAATYYAADAALTRAQSIAPADIDVLVLRAATKATLHDFRSALELGSRALKEAPSRDDALATVFDAQLETGEYAQARMSLDRLMRRVPQAPAVLVRQARLAWLTGDEAGARRDAARAAQAAVASATFGTGLAYYRVFQGQVELDTGNYDEAAGFYAQALQAAPDWHVAMAGQARAEAAAGDLTAAARSWRQAIAVVPQPEYLAALGDVLARSGNARGAAAQYGVLRATARLSKASGQLYNRQIVLFDADHGVHTREAVHLARAELSARGDVFGWDALAWALRADGQPAAAARASAHALRIGTEDARMLYHAGMIEADLGHRTAAAELLHRALAASPDFDLLQAPRARHRLASLGTSS